MKRGGRWLIVGLAIAVVFALLPIAGPAPAAAQSSDEGTRFSEVAPQAGESPRIPPEPDPGQIQRAQQHVINGTPIAITERPWHVLVSDESIDGTWCGGSIMAANLILTAAHCVDHEDLDVSRLLIVAGSDQWRDVTNGQWRFARNVTIHPSFDLSSGYDGSQGLDLALIELARPLTLNASVQPIELADPTEAAASLGGDADLAGWGVNTLPAGLGETVTGLLNGTSEVASDTFCGALIGRPLNAPLEMCIDGIETSQTGCFGDSGGGIAMEIGGVRKLLGVASFTLRSCESGILVISETATAVAWIEANTPLIATGAGFIEGRVWNDANFDSIEDPEEAGLSGIEVTLEIPPPSLEASSPISLSTVTDADGRYSFVAPFGGWYDVTLSLDPLIVLSPPGVEATEATNTDIQGRIRDPQLVQPTFGYTNRFLIAPGDTASDIDIGASPGSLVSGVIFDDLDRDGRRDGNEPLVSTIDAYIDVFRPDPTGDDSLIDVRYIGRSDRFMFAVPAGLTYLSFYDEFTDRRVTLPNRGDDDGDNDFSPFTNATEAISVVPGETYTFDLGVTPIGTGDVFADVANIDCDGQVSIIDALVIAQFSAGIRTDAGTCPLADPATQIVVANADMNLDGVTDIIDALLVAQCDAGLATPFCVAVGG